ncbi:MAG: hypothetical protein EOP07_19300 [Proteobacteria bacterium]|nr:MAG: hypothetical protein EOP07_19300 [Pseudomonadota bacterium]
MKHIALSLTVFLLISCAEKPVMVAATKNYSGDLRPVDADDCTDTDAVASGDATPVKTDTVKTGGTSTSDSSGADTKPVTPTTPVVVVPEPSKPVEPVTPAPVDEKLSKIKDMLAAKRLVSEYTVTDANAWGTSASSKIELMVAVDANGKALVPKDVKAAEVNGNVDAGKDGSFGTSSVHSVLKVCNQSKVEIRLHAQPNIPFQHSMSNIKKGACTLYFLGNANPIADGKSWDHNIGDKLPILFNVVKIKPDGSILK